MPPDCHSRRLMGRTVCNGYTTVPWPLADAVLNNRPAGELQVR
jgi:hypothetical protein